MYQSFHEGEDQRTKGGEPGSWQEVTASRWECVGYKLTGKEERGDVLVWETVSIKVPLSQVTHP